MPGRATEAAPLAAATASLKKRKRDAFSQQIGTLAEQPAFHPSSLQHLHSPVHLGYRDEDQMMSVSRFLSPAEMEHSRPRIQPSLSKRRRLLLQQQYQQHQQWSGTHFVSGQPRLYPLDTSLDIPPSNRSSPEISPKTLVPPRGQHSSHLTSASLLRPCHICHRRPTTREVLDAYGDCELCGERACYICLRECNAVDCCGATTPTTSSGTPDGLITRKDGHFEPTSSDGQQRTEWRYTHDGDPGRRRKVCSWCAVEGLTDGGMEIVRCLDCVRGLSPSRLLGAHPQPGVG